MSAALKKALRHSGKTTDQLAKEAAADLKVCFRQG
jgi:hypothetical protein